MKSSAYVFILVVLNILLFGQLKSHAGVGDTVVVQTFTFGSKQDSFFKFPPDTGGFRKIIMLYKLKCNPKQNPACGQWDYLTYTYLYQKTGIIDSTVDHVDSTYDSNTKKYTKYNVYRHYERLKQFEIARYITPYGINLDLGPGFTWSYDVTDYMSLLHDSVHLSAGNWQELLDVKFLFIKGKAARRPYKVVNVWNGNFPYGTSTSIEKYLDPRQIMMDSNASSVRMKVRVTGHGFGGNENCSEFCPKNHSLMVDGVTRWNRVVWRDNCAYNPVQPQGGTWLYQRTNWCPGSAIETYDVELTPYVKAGKVSTLNYNVDSTYQWNGQGSLPYFATETQLIYYKPTAFKLDAEMVDIITPSTADIYRHINPICASPKVIFRNNGSDTLRSLDFTYGLKGGFQGTYHWRGKLAFTDSMAVTLPSIPWAGAATNNVFQVVVSNPNGGKDEYADNNIQYSYVKQTPVIDNHFIILTKTNTNPSENAYTLKDSRGVTIFSKTFDKPNTIYRDTFTLYNNCYEFVFTDDQEDGLSFFANTAQGSGFVRFTNMSGKIIQTFNNDFGAELRLNFNTTYSMDVAPEIKLPARLDIYPNPANTEISIDATTLPAKPQQIQVYNIMGQLIYNKNLSGPDADFSKIDMSNQKSGNYIIKVTCPGNVYTEKIVVKH